MSPDLVSGFGLYNFSISEVHTPSSVEEAQACVARLRKEGTPVTLRGAGRSYGPVATCPRGAVVDLTKLRELTFLEGKPGRVRAQAGVMIADLWRQGVPKGFWPHVVPGTMFVSMGGAVAANIHGKNHYKRGSFAEHVESLLVLDEAGEAVRIARTDPRFHDHVAGYGAGGPILEIELDLKPVETGYFDVEGFTLGDLKTTLD